MDLFAWAIYALEPRRMFARGRWPTYHCECGILWTDHYLEKELRFSQRFRPEPSSTPIGQVPPR